MAVYQVLASREVIRAVGPDDLASEAAECSRLGDAAFAAGELEQAEDLHRQALGAYRQLGMGSKAATSLFRLAEVAEARGNEHAAEQLRAIAQGAEAPRRRGDASADVP